MILIITIFTTVITMYNVILIIRSRKHKINTNVKLINGGKYYSDKQINNIIDLLGLEYAPRKIIIYENRIDLIKYFFKISFLTSVTQLVSISLLKGNIEGRYDTYNDCVYIYVFAQNDTEYSEFDKTLFSLHCLLHELRHRYQYFTGFNKSSEDDADRFATRFINDKSDQISKIMNWKNEWEVEEE